MVVSFFAWGMRPNQIVHAFFNSVLVDEFCAPGIYPTGPIDSSNSYAVQVNGNWGDPLVCDYNGLIAGQFNIPASTFKCGDLVFEIADVVSLTEGSGAITTLAQATFTASSLSVTTAGVTLTTVNPIITAIPVTSTIYANTTTTVNSISNTVTVITTTTNTSVTSNVTNTVVTTIVVNALPTNTVSTQNTVITPPPTPNAPYGGCPAGYSWSDPTSGGKTLFGYANAMLCVEQSNSSGGEQITEVLSPIAQILTIQTPDSEAGIFATTLTVYFEGKSQSNNGVSVYILDTLNGYPDGNSELPFSRVHVNCASVSVSNDSSLGTTFTFEAPVFLATNTQYAFVVRPDADDPDYDIWCAQLGQTDILTGYEIYRQPVVGTLFLGPTFWQWSPVNNQYIKFQLDAANFEYSAGVAVMQNTDVDYLALYYGVTYANTTAGILPGDYIFGSNTGAVASACTSVHGRLHYYDLANEILYVDDSTGGFDHFPLIQVHRFANATLMTSPGPNTSTLVAYANVFLVHNPIVDAIMPQYAAMTPAGTGIVWDYQGTSNTYLVDVLPNIVHAGTETSLYDEERIVASKSNEVTAMGGAKSLTVYASMSTDSYLLSPVIDLASRADLVIENLIDPISGDYNEFFDYGSAQARYVSQVVTLAQGQDAQDLQVILSSHRPPGSDVQVWARFLNSQDTDPITAKTWSPLKNTGLNVYSSPTDPSDFEEFSYVTCSYWPMLSIPGTFNSTTSCTTITGVGTSWATQLQPGWWLNAVGNTTVGETSAQVVQIVSNTSIVLNQPFTMNHSGATLYLASPPTTPFLGIATTTSTNGTVTVSTTNNWIVGSSTSFLTDFQAGSIIGVDGDQQVVVSIANNTALQVGAPWTDSNTATPAFNITSSGLTYYNAQNALFTNFISFQLKIILQSNDTATVPILDNLRALALQL
jgi:hypothetical protein